MIFHTSEGEFVSREKPMKELEKELYNLNFRRCNLSYLVNLQYCSAIEGTYVKVGNEQLLISRAKRKSFIDEFRNYASI
jgi:DNA-binding LytR/AlgR family response regulator